ncbi:MAG: hypothetical protein LBS97_03465 [Treponema sp.]|jgi:RsiW-degrading membrane proteinase PrsW (M82 family)|nr:hypothetical protein [Treponema sp.]
MLYLSILLCFVPLIAAAALCLGILKSLNILTVLRSIFLGLAALIPVVLLQLAARAFPVFHSGQLPAILLTALLFNGIIEESIKMSAVSALPVKNAGLPEAAALGAILGLAFGCFEAVAYLIAGQQNILLRLCTAGVIHMVCTLLSSLSVWTWKQGQNRPAPFIYAVLVHGVYDFFARFSGGFWWFSIAAICFGAIECRVWYQKLIPQRPASERSEG